MSCPQYLTDEANARVRTSATFFACVSAGRDSGRPSHMRTRCLFKCHHPVTCFEVPEISISADEMCGLRFASFSDTRSWHLPSLCASSLPSICVHSPSHESQLHVFAFIDVCGIGNATITARMSSARSIGSLSSRSACGMHERSVSSSFTHNSSPR